jgi:hypothetical protein
MASITQDNILLDMSYLLGEQSIPTSGTEDRKRFIQAALERVYDKYNWDEARAITTLTIALSGSYYAGTLPSDIGRSPKLDVRVQNSGTNDDYIYEQIPYEERDNYAVGDYKYWLTGSEGSYTLNTKDSTDNLIVRYTQKAPSINASVSTTFPSSMVVARGALVYYRQAENPLADVSQDEAFFQNELQELIAKQNRNRPQKRYKGVQEVNGQYPGRI